MKRLGTIRDTLHATPMQALFLGKGRLGSPQMYPAMEVEARVAANRERMSRKPCTGGRTHRRGRTQPRDAGRGSYL